MRIVLFFLHLLGCSFYSYAQICKTDAPLVNTTDAYLRSVKADPRKQLVSLRKVIPGLFIDLRYATPDNFTKVVLYREPVPYLRTVPAQALKRAQTELNEKGLSLKLYDAFRPFSVTCKMWRLIGDRRYVANPRKGSYHNRALAIDVTLVDLHTGAELDMGTGYDNFTDSAHHNFYNLPPQVLANRKLLKATMRKYGFGMVPEEWWHYQWLYDRETYEVIDLDFDQLKGVIDER